MKRWTFRFDAVSGIGYREDPDMKILIGMSGGIDSSAAALLLKQAGHEVIGVTMSMYDPHNPILAHMTGTACFGPNSEQTIEESRAVCDTLGIPHYVVDLSHEYREHILDDFNSEYLAGRTPNPCVLCNRHIKFGALFDAVERMGITFDRFATGHYVNLVPYGDRLTLEVAADEKKDQSYFLYRLRQDQLHRIIFPLTGRTKEENRKLGAAHGLFAEDKGESQDFYSGHYSDLLTCEPVEGEIQDSAGHVLGTHRGFWNYTIGQRKGLGVSSDRPLYVIHLDAERNIVTVGHKEDTFSEQLTGYDANWMAIEELTGEMHVTAKIRSTSRPEQALIAPLPDNQVSVRFAVKQNAVTPGQSVVFYSDSKIIGGAFIKG